MNRIAPLTKLMATLALSLWALLLASLTGLGILLLVQLLLLLVTGTLKKTSTALRGLSLVALSLVGLQYLLGSTLEESINSGLRMLDMATAFIWLLATARPQDLSSALVQQCRVAPEYAFMFTTALRFIPDFFAESQAVQEAQACRGYSTRGNRLKALLAYLAVVKPLVLKAVNRSETMAMSMEMRGFGGNGPRSFSTSVALVNRDYAVLAALTSVTVGLVLLKLKFF
ncbi:MAG TPA: energy-coupling factor transporter transmembrane component T [Patescibacteria group bacterium]|nr:energy-coupling factor transporter transmembrane component T [Patescibacteria group bacterium]